MSIRWQAFVTPKIGHSVDECEDAVAGDPSVLRFAVADGAAESYAAGEWARLLVEAFVQHGPEGGWLAAPRREWLRRTAGDIPWYAEEKRLQGAHATFLGVVLEPVDGGYLWWARAAGDACLFVVSRGALLASFPLSGSRDFSTAPALVGTRGAEPPWQEQTGRLEPGDALLLATDALAQFLLASSETGRFAGLTLLELDAEDDFAFWTATMRGGGGLRNDDVAVGIIQSE